MNKIYIRTAIKERVCDLCGRMINAKERYKSIEGRDGREFFRRSECFMQRKNDNK